VGVFTAGGWRGEKQKQESALGQRPQGVEETISAEKDQRPIMKSRAANLCESITYPEGSLGRNTHQRKGGGGCGEVFEEGAKPLPVGSFHAEEGERGVTTWDAREKEKSSGLCYQVGRGDRIGKDPGREVGMAVSAISKWELSKSKDPHRRRESVKEGVGKKFGCTKNTGQREVKKKKGRRRRRPEKTQPTMRVAQIPT